MSKENSKNCCKAPQFVVYTIGVGETDPGAESIVVCGIKQDLPVRWAAKQV